MVGDRGSSARPLSPLGNNANAHIRKHFTKINGILSVQVQTEHNPSIIWLLWLQTMPGILSHTYISLCQQPNKYPLAERVNAHESQQSRALYSS